MANLPITLYPGMKIGQISFMRMTTPADVPYGSGAVGSKYQGQRGPTASRYHRDFERALGRCASSTRRRSREPRPLPMSPPAAAAVRRESVRARVVRAGWFRPDARRLLRRRAARRCGRGWSRPMSVADLDSASTCC